MFIPPNCLILGEVARPERFELPAFWFVVEKSGNPKALQGVALAGRTPFKNPASVGPQIGTQNKAPKRA